MNCSRCNGKTKVMDSVVAETRVIRRRKCMVCDYLFHTEETIGNNYELCGILKEIKDSKYKKKPKIKVY